MSIKMSYVRRNEIHVTVPTVPGPSTYEAGIATEKFQRYKPLRTDQISTETIKREGKKYIVRSTNTLNLFQIKNYFLKYESNLILPICKNRYKMDCIDYRYTLLPLTPYTTLLRRILSKLTPHVEEIGWDCQWGFRRAVENTSK